MSAIAGRVMPLMKGEYNSATTYEPLDFVTYNNALWGCIKTSKGNTPSEGTHWKKAIDGNVSDAASLGGETATQWQTKIDNIQTTSRTTLSQAGWYRVAEYATTDENIAKGFASNSCELTIKQRGDNTTGESIKLRLDSVLRKQSITAVSVKRHSTSYNAFTKCRYTYDSTGAYLEVYYSLSARNACLFVVDNPLDLVNTWKAITPTLTAETVDGVTVTTTYDIPSNATPTTSADLANYLDKRTGGDINGNVRLLASDASLRQHELRNSVRQVYQQVNSGGYYYLHDGTNGKHIITSTPDGTNTFNGTASGNLPLDGTGEVVASNLLPLKAKNSAANSCFTRYSGKDGVLGFLGFMEANTPYVLGSDGAGVGALLHAKNFNNYALPLDGGGTVQAANSNPLKVKNTSGNDCYIPFVGKGGTLGYLGFSNTDSLIFVTADAAAATEILHTGNSARVVPATSAPSDTTVLWIDTANKKVKSYIDGAWTALA